MQKRRVIVNAIMASVQIVVVTGAMFILYRFLLETIGVEQVGIWALVLVTTAVTQIANLGLSGSVIKYVAKYIAHEEKENISRVIQTAALSVGGFSLVVLLAGYPIARWIFGLVIPAKSLQYALHILPFAFFALWLLIITSVFQAGLDGFQRIDLRSFLLMGGAVLDLLLCFILAPRFGLMGVAYARVIQNFSVLAFSWLLLRRLLPLLPILPYKWSMRTMKEIIGYSAKFQLMSFCSLFFEPTTKALLSKFGGLSMVGYYEMASRMIMQFRALIANATQVLVPVVADLHENIPEKIKHIFVSSYRLLFYISLPIYTLIIISAPIVSTLWIGHIEGVFVFSTVLLSIGWFLNTLNIPAFVANLGTGELRWNILGQITIAVLNALLGFLLGMIYGGNGVIVAWIISLALGSSVVYIVYHIKQRIPLIELLPKDSKSLVATSLVGILTVFVTRGKFEQRTSSMIINIAIFLSFLIIVSILLWRHPMRGKLIRCVTNELLKGSAGNAGRNRSHE